VNTLFDTRFVSAVESVTYAALDKVVGTLRNLAFRSAAPILL
jgi:hypothetical protein